MNSGRADKWSENNPERLTKEQARKKVSSDREQARKKASFDREQAIEEGQKARKLKTGKHLPE